MDTLRFAARDEPGGLYFEAEFSGDEQEVLELWGNVNPIGFPLSGLGTWVKLEWP